MKNTFGSNITVTLFGESHGSAVGCTLDGVAPGIRVDMEYIRREMDKRRAVGDISTPRQEADEVEIISGVKDGYTEGTPITLLIRNESKISAAYSELRIMPRPSHADFTAECKYHGYQDHSGGGHFSGRLTAPLVAAGAILRSALLGLGIKIGTHISSLHGISDIPFSNIGADIDRLSALRFPVLSTDAAEAMKERIKEVKGELDSVGGVLECAIVGVPTGLGEPWFDTVEGLLAHAMLSIPGVKGIEFGAGFALANMKGSEANDPFYTEGGKIYTEKNNSGGVNGGITNGMPIVFRLAVRPTPSIGKEQKTVDLEKMENTTVSVGGRHDPAIIHRARAVVDALAAIVIADLIATRYGTDHLAGGASGK